MIPYITFQDLCSDIRNNIHKIPKNIMGIIGTMRSGMIPASIISQYLNVGLTTLDNFCKNVNNNESIFESHGHRPLRETTNNIILVVDDTCSAGVSILKNKTILSDKKFKDFEFIYLSIYMEGDCRLSKPDIFLKSLHDLQLKSDVGCVLYEWNIFHHHMQHEIIYDFDGVFCVDPPDDHNVIEYETYLKNSIPLFIPTSIATLNILTFRKEIYRKETEDFLKSNNVMNFKLYMFDESKYGNRDKILPGIFKGQIYKISPQMKLFIESNDYEAQQICQISEKSVYCVSTNKMYNFN